jgi:hypothetical protein
MDHPRLAYLNWIMARCKECNSVVTRNDSECYICGLPVASAKRPFWRSEKKPKLVPAVTPLSNLLFVASLGLTLFSFLSPNTMSVSFGATLGGILFVARIVSDRIALKQQLALRPVTVARLD